MTNPTPPGSGPGAGGSEPPLGIDWATVFDQLGKLGADVVGRFAERASENATKVRQRAYGRDDLIDDAEWFWANLASDANRGLEIWRTKPPAGA